jgi:creatinine deaminase
LGRVSTIRSHEEESAYANYVCRENETFVGGEEYLKQRGVEVVVLDNAECKGLMAKFIKEKPSEW